MSLAILLAAGLIGAVRADNTAPRPRLSVPSARLTPLLTADPSDPAWAAAAVIPALTVSLGEGGKGLAPLPTQVKLLWDQNNLYLRFICTATEIYAPAKEHDADLYHGDVVEVFLDVQGDSKQWIELEVSPDNVTFDQLATLTAEPASNADLILNSDVLDRNWWMDLSWSLDGWKTAAAIQKTQGHVTGWTVDMALPAKAVLHRLGQDKYSPMTLRANFLRYEELAAADPKAARRLLAMNWAPVIYGCPHISPLAMGYVTLAAP
ncbi:MAG: carbohydrate-binding family 9-like protein [Janthinobacterium lividum]